VTTADYEHNVVLATTKYDVVGSRPIRHDGADVLTADPLHGKILRSHHTHARIESIDTSEAEAYPGVRAVVTAKDLPMIDTVIVEVANPGHRYGARGVGEVPIVPPMAAVANAIADALGVRLNVLPMTPAKVLEALWEQGGS
jgi:CO/xanthine dehydrogenase Mo-binding subunit